MCFDEYVGLGYVLLMLEMVEVVQLFVKIEGILFDLVYIGKVVVGLIDLIRKGNFNKEDNILFVYLGGLLVLYVNIFLFV